MLVPPPVPVPPLDVPPLAVPPLLDVPPLDVAPPEDEVPPPDAPEEVEGVEDWDDVLGAPLVDGVAVDGVAVVLDDEELDDEPEPEEPDDAGSSAVSGATSVGVVRGTRSAVSLLPPQADTPPARTSARTAAMTGRRMAGKTIRSVGRCGDRIHAPAAGRAVVEILLRHLVTPRTETQVLHGPREL